MGFRNACYGLLVLCVLLMFILLVGSDISWLSIPTSSEHRSAKGNEYSFSFTLWKLEGSIKNQETKSVSYSSYCALIVNDENNVLVSEATESVCSKLSSSGDLFIASIVFWLLASLAAMAPLIARKYTEDDECQISNDGTYTKSPTEFLLRYTFPALALVALSLTVATWSIFMDIDKEEISVFFPPVLKLQDRVQFGTGIYIAILVSLSATATIVLAFIDACTMYSSNDQYSGRTSDAAPTFPSNEQQSEVEF